MGCHSLLQGIFLTQGLNLGLLYYMKILYCLSHQGSLYYFLFQSNSAQWYYHHFISEKNQKIINHPRKHNQWPRCIQFQFFYDANVILMLLKVRDQIHSLLASYKKTYLHAKADNVQYKGTIMNIIWCSVSSVKIKKKSEVNFKLRVH